MQNNSLDVFQNTLQLSINKNKENLINYLSKDQIKNIKNKVNLYKKTSKSKSKSSSIRPEDDFYGYINNTWVEESKKLVENKNMKTYYENYDSYRIIQDKVYKELDNLIKSDISSTKSKLTKNIITEIKNVYNSALTGYTSKTKQILFQHISDTIQTIDQFYDNSDLYGLLAYSNRNELVCNSCPIVWKSQPNILENPTLYISHLLEPILPFYNSELYGDKEMTKEKKEFLIQYDRYNSSIWDFVLHNVKSKSKIFEEVINENKENKYYLEVPRDILWCLDKSGTNNRYSDPPIPPPKSHPLQFTILNIHENRQTKLFNNFDFFLFFKKLGFIKPPKRFACVNLDYLNKIIFLLTNNESWKSNKWKYWFYYINICQQLRFTEESEKIYINFFNKFQQNVSGFPKYLRPIFMVSLMFNKYLTDKYVAYSKNESIIEYVAKLASNLKTVFIYSILSNPQYITTKHKLSIESKNNCIEKIKNISMIFGTSEYIPEDPLLDYTYNDIWKNIEKIYEWRKIKRISLENDKVIELSEIDWKNMKLVGRQSYIVNAFYTQSRNDVYIPFAYLQKPFIDLDDRPLEYNLANIGNTIAHELAHAVDTIGILYDKHGKLNPIIKDQHVYQNFLDSVTNHYVSFMKRDNVDTTHMVLYQRENIADIYALKIIEFYLDYIHSTNKDLIEIQKLSYLSLYIYYTHQMKQFISQDTKKYKLYSDNHPPAKYRINVPLSRSIIFYTLFNINKNDKMYVKH